jgi:hypothetical protein
MKGPLLPLPIHLHGGPSLSIIMDRYEEHLTALTIALHGGLPLDIIIHRYEGHLNALTIPLLRGLYLAIIMDRARRPLLSHYYGPLWRALFCPYYRLPWTLLLSYYNGPL